MLSSAEISVVDTFGSPNRLKRSSETSRILSAVRRGAFFGMASAWLQLQLEPVEDIVQRRGGAAQTPRLPHGNGHELAQRVRQLRASDRDAVAREFRREAGAPGT